MAFLVQRGPDRYEIRESLPTPRGPRARCLTRFSGALTPAVLARAAAHATRPFDAQALRKRARGLGLEVSERSPESEARALLVRLRRGDPIDPVLAGLVQRALAAVETCAVPEALEEVAEWIGASPHERGAALRDLLETYGRIASARPARRRRPRRAFPRFSSAETAAAS